MIEPTFVNVIPLWDTIWKNHKPMTYLNQIWTVKHFFFFFRIQFCPLQSADQSEWRWANQRRSTDHGQPINKTADSLLSSDWSERRSRNENNNKKSEIEGRNRSRKVILLCEVLRKFVKLVYLELYAAAKSGKPASKENNTTKRKKIVKLKKQKFPSNWHLPYVNDTPKIHLRSLGP